jgi:hypothetical protein
VNGRCTNDGVDQSGRSDPDCGLLRSRWLQTPDRNQHQRVFLALMLTQIRVLFVHPIPLGVHAIFTRLSANPVWRKAG